MLKKLFAKKKEPLSHDELVDDAVMRAIADAKQTDPLVGLSIGAKEVLQRLMDGIKNERGIHVDTLLGIIGSLAGFSCQMGIREGLIRTGKITRGEAFMEVTTEDGRNFYVGQVLNEPLLSAPYSIRGLAGGGAQRAGCTNMPTTEDTTEMLGHSISTLGTPQFGIPRLPEGHEMMDLPVNWVRYLWPMTLQLLTKFCDSPLQWHIMMGMVAQEAIIFSKDALDPRLAFDIVMECAIATSKLDPAALGINAAK